MSTSPAAVEVSSSTPILDRQLPVPPVMEPSTKTIVAEIIYGLILGTVLPLLFASMISASSELLWTHQPIPGIKGWLAQLATNSLGGSSLAFVLILIIVSPLLAMFAAFVVHELGHFIAGLFTGFQLLAIHIGSLQIVPPFHLKWSPKDRLPGAAGMAALVPIHSRNLRSRAIIMLLGGPAINLVTGFALAFLLPSYGLLSAWFIFFSVMLGVVNLVPFRRLAMHSDGKRILMLLRNSHQGERWLALLKLRADLESGTEFENSSPEFIAIATAVHDDSPETVMAYLIAHLLAFSRHDDLEAARLLEICLKYSGSATPQLRESVLTQAALFQARRRKRAALAEQWLAELPEKTIVPQNRVHAETAILEAKGDVPGALKKLDEAEAIVLKSAEPYRRDLSLKYLRSWRAELQQKQPLAADLR